MKERKNENYIRSFPSSQNAINIFKTEWSSKLPERFNIHSGGLADLFDDQRIHWAKAEGVNFKGKKVLELGPLEGGHSWMMEQSGANEIIAIEAHERAFLKCLITKELTQMSKTRFVHGDFECFLQFNEEKFDICLASGILYHSVDPVTLLHNICRHCDQIILWSHYFDSAAIKENNPSLLNRFGDSQCCQYMDTEITLHPFVYLEEVSEDSFCGGPNSGSNWLERGGIETIFGKNDFEITAEGFNHPAHPNGPAVAFIAKRKVAPDQNLN